MVNLVRAATTLIGQGKRDWAVFEAALSDLKRKRYRDALGAFEALARKGHREAQFYAGSMYRLGQGGAADPARAAQWFRKAAEAGHGRAMAGLGTLYIDGKGVPQDDVEAYKWLLLSMRSKDGWEDAELSLLMLRLRMTEQQLAEAEARARTLAPNGAKPARAGR